MTDPEQDVPARPEFVMRVRAEADGSESAWLDDDRVTVPAGVGIHRALIEEARRRADQDHAGETIRVAGVTADNATFHLAIGPDGDAWEVPAPSAYDEPDAVPDDVAHVVELQENEGRLVGLVDSEQVSLVAGEDPYEQLLHEARHRADEYAAGKTVRVLSHTPDGRVWHVALTPDGTQQVVPPVKVAAGAKSVATTENSASPAVNAFRPAEPELADTEAAAYNETRSGLTDDLGRPIPTTTTHVTAHEAFTPIAREPEEPAAIPEPEPEPQDEPPARRGPSRRALLFGGAGVIALGAAATVGYFASHDDDTRMAPTPAPTGTPLGDGIRPPAGLPASYLWSVVNISDVSPELVVTETQLVCTVNNDTTGGTDLVSIDPSTGKTQWKAELPVDAVVSSGPTRSPVDGADSIVLTTQSEIIVYPMTGGEAKTWPLQRNWVVSSTPSGVIVTRPDQQTRAYILWRDQLAPRAIPAGSTPVALLTDGTVVATNAHGQVWLSNDPTKPSPVVQLAAPRGTRPGTFVAATASQLITAFVPKSDPGGSRLRVFSLPDLKPLMTTAAIDPAVFPDSFMLTPDQTWAVASNVWLDLRTGRTHVITARWSPIAISQHNSWSKSGDNVLTADARGRSLGAAHGSGGQVAVPRGGTAKLAYCVASIGSQTTLYAIPLKA